MSNQRELELLRRTVARDRTAFTELYLLFHPRLARFLMRMTSQHDLIENVVNETLWIVWQKCADFRGHSLVSTWIVGIAYRCALKQLRKTRSLQRIHDGETPIAPDAHALNENWEWLDRAMAELPPEQRTVLELSYIGGHSCEEIASIMQCPITTVKTRMFHARTKLRRSLPRLALATRERSAPETSAWRAGTKAANFF
jgi:RNA polymerase sigma-70 factor (ECF subfamily)